MRAWFSFKDAHRSDVRDRFKALPPLPEADRMKTKPVLVKPKNFAEWERLHNQQRRRA